MKIPRQDGGFPLYDRQHVPDGCHSCAFYREELRRIQVKNESLRNEVRFLQGIPPRTTNMEIDRLHRDLKAARGQLERAGKDMAALAKRNGELRDTIGRVKEERDKLRAALEASP